MNWNKLESIEQLAAIDAVSQQQPVLLYKHSTRCSISSAALARLERGWDDNVPVKPYYLDLIAFRDVSGEIAARYGVMHESPQILLIKNGICIYNESHMSIDVNDMLKALALHSN